MDIQRFVDITLERMLEVAIYQKALCGKLDNLGKPELDSTESSDPHTSLSYMDTFTQDFLMVPLFRDFPDMVPMVEEDTPIKRLFQNNKSEWAYISDAVDGTLFFLQGQKDFSILTGLAKNGRMVAGVACYPETGDRYVVKQGEPVYRVSPSGVYRPLPNLSAVQENPRNLAVHYRFLKPPMDDLAKRLADKGYSLASTNIEFGTNLTAVLRLFNGQSEAFVAPHMALHDFAVPLLMVQSMGGVAKIFPYKGSHDTAWSCPQDPVFENLDPTKAPPRYRVILAKNQAVMDRLITNFNEK